MMEGDKARLVDSQNRALDVVHRAIESLHSVLELTGVDAADLKVRFAQLPVLWITGTLASAGASKTAYYTCPCYKAPRRTGLNFVTSVDLRVEENPSKWVLRGVALLTSTE